MRSPSKARTVAPGQTYPYQITCTACDARLLAVDREWIVLVGPRPVELVAGLAGDTHIACHQCGNMVLLDRDLLLLR
jgi:hypothetical protein